MPVASPVDDREGSALTGDADSEVDGVASLLPADDGGYQLQPRDTEYLNISPQQVGWWSRREAPLGMTPRQYKEFKESLYAALEADGISPDEVDIRLQGSSAHFFSGAHKRFPSDDDPVVQTNELAQRGLREWFADDVERPLRYPFDSKYTLGLRKKKSDYDVQISSDAMVKRCQAKWESGSFGGDFINAKYGFVQKTCFRRSFPELHAWARQQERRLGRDVAPALFASSGPRDNTPAVSAHFRSTDWTIERDKQR